MSPRGVGLGARGLCIHLVSARLSRPPGGDEAKGKEGKHADKAGSSVVMYVVDRHGDPVGAAAQWPSRGGASPVWNAAHGVGGFVGNPPASAPTKLVIELWEVDGSSAILAA
eukprot:421998-Prymnesium_polylepis.1